MGERRDSGYTLIELLIVVVVLAIVASIALTAMRNALDRAKQRATMADMRTISKAIEAYQTDHGGPPSGGPLDGLRSVLIPYHTSALPLSDHWGRPLVYSSDGVANYTLESYGKDGVDGADISLSSRFEFDQDIVLVNGQFVASPE